MNRNIRILIILLLLMAFFLPMVVLAESNPSSENPFAALETTSNLPPYEPSNPSPAMNAFSVGINSELSWSGGDPDGDTVTYDVYLEQDDITPDTLISSAITNTVVDQLHFTENKNYYWQVVATDQNNETTDGPIWHFMTETDVPTSPWEEVGTGSAWDGGISDSNIQSWSPDIAVAPDGTPYITWDEDSKIYVRRWNRVDWEEVSSGSASGDGISGQFGIARSPSIAITSDNTPYIAWGEYADGDSEIYVRCWNGTSWEEVGSSSASGGGISNNSGESYSVSIAILPDGTPYIAWHDDTSGNYEIYVRRWNGSIWEEVGTGSASGNGISGTNDDSRTPSLTIDTNGTPYITWQENQTLANQIYVRRWNGTAWEEVGAESASGSGISNTTTNSTAPDIAITSDGTPYITWAEDVDDDSEIYVRRWNGTDWEEIGVDSANGGGISNTDSSSREPAIAISSDGVIYISWSEIETDGGYTTEIYVRRWLNGSWEEVGANSASGDGISNTDSAENSAIAIAPDGNPYVAWQDDSNEHIRDIFVRRWDNDPQSEETSNIYLPLMLKNMTGDKFSWKEVGVGSASDGGINNTGSDCDSPSIAISDEGIPYITWVYEIIYTHIHVRRWIGNDWEEVGYGSASGDGISYYRGWSFSPSVDIAPDGTPYITWAYNQEDDYIDKFDEWEIYVLRWNGTDWENVGVDSAYHGGISDNDGKSTSPDIAIAPDGTPYITWVDYENGDDTIGRIYVRRWNGTDWEEVGTGSASGAGISNTTSPTNSPAIAISSDGTPYIAWSDSSSGNGEIYVRRWNGSSWIEVGGGSASGGGISNDEGTSYTPAIDIALDGNPYITWSNWGAGDVVNIYVKRWNGASWEEVGPNSASGGGLTGNTSMNGYAEHASIAIDDSGAPYITWYGNYENNNGIDTEIYITRWNGINWEDVGSNYSSGTGISNSEGRSNSPDIAISPDGTPYVTWEDMGDSDSYYSDIYVRRYTDSGVNDQTIIK